MAVSGLQLYRGGDARVAARGSDVSWTRCFSLSSSVFVLLEMVLAVLLLVLVLFCEDNSNN